MGDSVGLGAWMASVYAGFVIGVAVCVYGHFREKRTGRQKDKDISE